MKKRIPFLFIIFMLIGSNQELLSQNKNIEITSKRNPDKSVDLSYTKKIPGSYYLKLEFTTLENCRESDFETVIKNSTGRLLRLEPINNKQPINFSYKFHWARGNPNAKVDEDFVYILPFKKGETVKIKETNNLKETYFNAEKDENWKSFIADRNTADTIYSMRKGIVIDLIDTFKTDSLDAYRYTSKMNKVVIEHEDGTISRYTGFNSALIFVTLGQTVYPQTKLGVLDLFNNSLYRLYFDLSFLKEVDFSSINKRDLSSESIMQHITPYFYSSNGPITLTYNSDYSVEINDTTRFKEFSKRELKKYKKTPQLFE